MSYFKFYLGTGFVDCEYEEIVELPDHCTDQEVDEEYRAWVNEKLDRNWWELTEDEMEGEE